MKDRQRSARERRRPRSRHASGGVHGRGRAGAGGGIRERVRAGFTRHPWRWLACVSLLVIGAVAYAPCLDAPFLNWDDPAYVTGNPYITSLAPGAVLRLFAPSTIVLANWAPITLLSYAVDHAAGGLDPAPFHRTNVILHLLCGVLVCLLLWRLTGRAAAGWVGALLFLLHPIQIESVAWVAERKNVLSLALALAAMLVELGVHRPATEWPGLRRRAIALALFALALLAKATVVVVPLLLILCWRMIDDRRWRTVLRRAAPYLLLSLVVGVITMLAQRTGGGIKPYYAGSPLLTAATMVRVLWLELALFFTPGRLAAVYRPPVATTLLTPSIWIATLGLVGIAIAAVRWRHRYPVAVLLFAWYGVGLLPVLNLLPLPHLMADRFLYISSIGLAGLVAVGIDALVRRVGGRWDGTRLTVIVGLLIGSLCFTATRDRLPVWSSSERLWRDTLEQTPGAEVAHSNLGLVLAGRGEHATALEHYRRAVELRADYTEARINLANALTRTGRPDAALAEYGRAIALDPTNAEIHYNMGVTLAASGDPAAARRAYENALRHDSRHAGALNNLALLEIAAGEQQRALERLDTALRVRPTYAEARLNRGVLLGQLQRYDEALEELRQAIAVRPDYAQAHLQLGLGLFGAGRQAEGRAAVARALQLEPGLAERLPPAVQQALGLSP